MREKYKNAAVRVCESLHAEIERRRAVGDPDGGWQPEHWEEFVAARKAKGGDE